ncbi:FAD-dependent oxidoreductase [Variovorax beijingensis]|uniref:FAD-dependent oxidoreductase n=1 Tax=Variovorax beijingensis TaxID=2496117 RepID=A0A3P3EVT9_9BURK|nr:FAD-dependent oxidoreductase [Variovorax beijingensis]RRH90307.1 FAD-dependent oxidoreductase [Variovorax beijingensis]
MKTPGIDRYDVVVVGGGAAGVASALGSARQGARTLLVERYGFLGGAATNSLVLTYCGFYVAGREQQRAVGGVGWELLRELQRLGFDSAPVRSKSGNWLVMLDVEAVKFAFDNLVASPNLHLRFHTRLVSAEVEGGCIKSVRLADHAGLHDVEAAAFVDASGEASLSAFAGATLSLAGGPGAHLQPASLPVHIGGVPPDVPIEIGPLAAIVERYNATAQTQLARADGGILVRLPGSEGVWWMGVDLVTPGLEGSDLARAETQARRQAWEFLPYLRELPGFHKAFILSTGPQLGIRETRRPRSIGDVTADDGSEGRRRDDGIGRGCWPMEVHEAPGRAVYLPIGGEGFFDIPYSAIQAQTIGNLRLAGRVTGADQMAYGSTRVMGTAFATGHAAGVSAALQSGQGAVPDADAVRRILRAQDAIV